MKKILALLVLMPLASFAQTIHSDYQDGKIWFKLTNEVRVAQPLKEDPYKIPVQSIPGLSQIAAKYEVTNLSKPFYAAKNSEILQRTYLIEFNDFQQIDGFINDPKALKGVEYAEH